LHDLDLIARIPRLAAVQAAGAAPFAASYATAFAERVRVQPQTVASAIRIGDPASYDRAVAAIQGTHGVVTAVPDEEILEAKAIVDASGIGCEPASAASVAGVRRLVRQNVIMPGERVVAVLTGHLLKDPEAVLAFHRAGGADAHPLSNSPMTIDPTLAALEAAAFSKT
jgi:threonine synthase